MLGQWLTRLHHSQKILGINARNISYVKPYNKRKAIERVDDKIHFKRLLERHSIPTPALLATIRSYHQLREFEMNSLPSSFVLKPAAGFGGGGIVVVYGEKKRPDSTEERTWVRGRGDHFPEFRIRNHVYNILDGSFSRTNTPDIAFFEERIKMTKFFRPLAYKGIPDLRIIVFNSTPVMAMLRLPTRQSGGAANLHAGGIGVGIDIATGVTTNAIMNDQLIEYLPESNQLLSGIKLPQWEKVLRIAIETAQITHLGFAGIDIALDREKGPVVLEANARPGLAIQIANLAPLKERLEKVQGLKVPSVKRGIRIAQDLFGGEIEEEVEDITGKQVVGLTQTVTLYGPAGAKEITAKVDTGADSSSVDWSVLSDLGLEHAFEEFERLNVNPDTSHKKLRRQQNEINTQLDEDPNNVFEKVLVIRSGTGFSLRPYIKISSEIEGTQYTGLYSVTDRSHMQYKMIIGKPELKNFLIDPTKR